MPKNVGGVGHVAILWCVSEMVHLSDKPKKPQRWSTDRLYLYLRFVLWLRHGSFFCTGELCPNFLAPISGQIISTGIIYRIGDVVQYVGRSKIGVKCVWLLKTSRQIPLLEHSQLDSHIHCLDRIILKTANDRCTAYADAGVLVYENICVRLYSRNITIFEDRVGCADHMIMTCRHPFVEHFKDVLQRGIFCIFRFMLL